MHKSAFTCASKFYEDYCTSNIENKTVLDIGSQDFNGCMKPIFKHAKKYIGLDMEPGANVDMVSSGHDIDLPDESFDIIISSSCFEHDNMFWVTFLEMCRIVKVSGYIYVNVPHQQRYHGYPSDYWRFMHDAGAGLEDWAKYNDYNNIKLVKSYVSPGVGLDGHDMTMIWNKSQEKDK